MFRSIYTKTLRDYRVPLLAWGLGLALLVYFALTAFASQFTTPQSREEIATLAQTFRFMAEPVATTTPAGYVTWKYLDLLPLILGIWPALAGVRLIRGAEARGSLDIILSTPHSRARVLGAGIAALATALALIGVLIGLGALGGAAAIGEPVGAGRALLTGLNVSLAALVVGLLALLLAQFTPRTGTAAGLALGLLVLSWLLAGVGRSSASTAWLERLSPYYLYSSNKPLIADYPLSLTGYLGLLALALLCGALSFPLFMRRDLGGVAWVRRGMARRVAVPQALAAAARRPALRGVGPLALRAALPGIIWWTIGLALLTLLMIGITPATKDSVAALVAQSPAFAQLFSRAGLDSDAGFLSGVLFLFLPALLALYALTIAGGWARDLDAGRLEIVLGTPLPRWRLYLATWGATLAALIAAPLVLWLIALLGTRLWGLQVGAGYLLAAFLGLLPLELPVAALVYLGAGRLGAGALSGIVGGLIGLSYLLELLGTFFTPQKWLLDLSIFHQYGAPIVEGPRWGAWLLLTAVAALFLALGLARFSRADLQRGG